MMFKKKNKKGWNDITLAQLQELSMLPEFEDELDSIINQLSILLDKTFDEIEAMPIEDMLSIFKEYSFLSKIPEPKYVPMITIQGKRYGMVQLNKISLGQLADIEMYAGDNIMDNIHKIISVFYLPIKNYNRFTKKMVLEEYEPDLDRQELFKSVTLDVIYPQILFFWNIVNHFIKNSTDSMLENQKKRLSQLMTMKLNQEEVNHSMM